MRLTNREILIQHDNVNATLNVLQEYAEHPPYGLQQIVMETKFVTRYKSSLYEGYA